MRGKPPIRGPYDVLMLMAVIAITSCAPREPEPRACTMIGCESGVAVDLSAVPSGAYSAEPPPLPDGAPTLKQCTTAAACGRSLFFEGVATDSVAIRLTTSEGTRTLRARAEYVTSRPNGPQCDPTCRQARVAVAVP